MVIKQHQVPEPEWEDEDSDDKGGLCWFDTLGEELTSLLVSNKSSSPIWSSFYKESEKKIRILMENKENFIASYFCDV